MNDPKLKKHIHKFNIVISPTTCMMSSKRLKDVTFTYYVYGYYLKYVLEGSKKGLHKRQLHARVTYYT